MKIYEIRFNNQNSIFETCEGEKELKKALSIYAKQDFKDYLKDQFDVELKSIQVKNNGYTQTAIGSTSHNDIYNY